MSRPREPRIARLETHPRQSVGLTVAAKYLGLHLETVRARIEDGSLDAVRDGRRYWIPVVALKAYEARRLGRVDA